MNFFGLGKERTKLGRWLDERGVTQQWLVKQTKLNKLTISNLANDEEHTPTFATMKKIITALRKIDPNVKQDDFWSM